MLSSAGAAAAEDDVASSAGVDTRGALADGAGSGVDTRDALADGAGVGVDTRGALAEGAGAEEEAEDDSAAVFLEAAGVESTFILGSSVEAEVFSAAASAATFKLADVAAAFAAAFFAWPSDMPL